MSELTNCYETGISIEKSGVLATVQDNGRFDGLKFGVPQSGVMDTFAYEYANGLVGNPIGTPVIEITYGNFEAVFWNQALIAVTGAETTVKINGCEITRWASYKVNPGDRLSVALCKNGMRNYLAIRGAWQLPEPKYGSYSTYRLGQMGGINGDQLKPKDQIHILWDRVCEKRALINFEQDYFKQMNKNHKVVRVVLGPQAEAFSELGIKHFLEESYRILPESDRMGMRLKGKEIGHIKPADIISDGIAFGAIQVPSNGQPIIMMADRQTTGGYTKIGTVISIDLPILAQAKVDDSISFTYLHVSDLDRLIYPNDEDILNYGEIMGIKDYQIKIKNKSFYVKVEELISV